MADTRPILVIDDDPDLREALGEVLTEQGHPTRLAENGRVALDALRNGGERPKLILLDLMMPEMNGWQFREAQLGDERLRDIPVIVMTASHRIDPGRLGDSEVLYKPVGIDALLEAIERNAC